MHKTTSLKQRVASSRFARVAAFPSRARSVARYDSLVLGRSLRWLLSSREHTNFTYNLAPLNRVHLCWFVSLVTRKPFDQIQGYLDEIDEDEKLKAHVRRMTEQSPRRYLADTRVEYGRRIGWYAITRAIRPRQVVETGTDKGLGSVVLASALIRNAEESDPGFLTTIDINPDSGYLISNEYGEVTNRILGDSLEQLRNLESKVDMFLHDSDHHAPYEAAEYRSVATHLSNQAFVLSDNAHCSNELSHFAQETGRQFLFFDERPDHHWYPGAGLGIAWHSPVGSGTSQ